MIPYKPNLKVLARNLRNKSTEEEIILWSKIRKKQIADITFYKQKPLHGYIADFYAPKINLVIELDGSQHLEKENIEYDNIRSHIFNSQGINVKRYYNNQIRNELNLVIEDLYQYARHYRV